MSDHLKEISLAAVLFGRDRRGAESYHSASLRSGEALRASIDLHGMRLSFCRKPAIPIAQCLVMRKRFSDTLRLIGEVLRTVMRLTASDTSDQKDALVVGTGSAGEPLNFC